jgi:hypothetical protein
MSGQIISLQEAIILTSNFRTRAATSDILSFSIDNSILLQIISQPGCTGVRVYAGLDLREDNKQFVFVGVDEFGVDMYHGVIVDKILTCPRICPPKSPLNSDDLV